MYPTNPIAASTPALMPQLNIFGEVDEIQIKPQRVTKAALHGPGPLHDAPVTTVKTVKPIKTLPKPTQPDQTHALPISDELLLDPDDPITINLESIEASDTPETILSKRMFLRMMWDIEGKSEDAEPDLFGQTSLASKKASQSDLNRLDALIWLYSLNPDAGLVTFEWVCDVLGFCPHRVRRIVGRSLRKELKRLVLLLSTIVGPHHAQICEDKISDYLDISNWRFN